MTPHNSILLYIVVAMFFALILMVLSLNRPVLFLVQFFCLAVLTTLFFINLHRGIDR